MQARGVPFVPLPCPAKRVSARSAVKNGCLKGTPSGSPGGQARTCWQDYGADEIGVCGDRPCGRVRGQALRSRPRFRPHRNLAWVFIYRGTRGNRLRRTRKSYEETRDAHLTNAASKPKGGGGNILAVQPAARASHGNVNEGNF